MQSVFVEYAYDDAEKVKPIIQFLETNGVKVITDNDILPGVKVDGLRELIRSSDRLVLFVTKENKECNWISLQTIVALEQSLNRKHMLLRVICHDVNKEDVPILQEGLLSCIPHSDDSVCNTGASNQEILDWLKGDIPLKELLPVGNIALGLLFSHYFGYQGYVIKNLEKILTTDPNDRYINNKNIFPLRLYQLLPESCKIRPDLCTSPDEEKDTRIRITKEPNCILQSDKDHVGKHRTLVVTIYKLEHLDTREVFMCCAGFPPSLGTISALNEGHAAKVNVKLAYTRYLNIYTMVVNHKESEKKEAGTSILPVKDLEDKTAFIKTLYDAVKNDVTTQNAQEKDDNEASAGLSEQLQRTQLTDTTQRVYMLYLEESAPDCEAAKEMCKFFEDKDKKVVDANAGTSNLHIPEADFYIIVFSKACLQTENDLFLYKCNMLLTSCITNNVVNIVPVLLEGVAVNDIPLCVGWVSFVRADDDCRLTYMDNILQLIEGKPMTLTCKMPAGDVVTGLAWSYVLNYLQIVLFQEDLKRRIQNLLMKNGEECGCLLKLISVWPMSCRSQKKLDQAFGSSVKYIGPLQPVIADTGGQCKRQFKLHMFKYTYTHDNKEQSVCLLSEYCTPIGTLRSMVDDYTYSGLTEAELGRQGEEFLEIFEEIVNRDNVKQKIGDMTNIVKIVRYDEKAGALMEAVQGAGLLTNKTIDESTLIYRKSEQDPEL